MNDVMYLVESSEVICEQFTSRWDNTINWMKIVQKGEIIHFDRIVSRPENIFRQ